MSDGTVTTEQIRKALKDQLTGIGGLVAYATMPASPRLPCIVPMPASWRYDVTAGDSITWQFRLWIYLPKDDINKSQLAFDSYISPKGPNSVPARLALDPTLGGVVDSISVMGGDQYLAEGPVGGVPILGAYLLCEVFA